MSLVRRIARPLLAATFVYGGIDTFRNPAPRVPNAEKVVSSLPQSLPGMSSTEDLVKVDAAAKVLAGIALAFGKLPRAPSLVLAASLIPTTAAGHRFWEEEDAATKAHQRTHFLKNLGL